MTSEPSTNKKPLTAEQKLEICLQRATYPRGQLEMIAVEMAEIMGVDIDGVGHRALRAVVYGKLTLEQALQHCVNAKLAAVAAIEIEGKW